MVFAVNLSSSSVELNLLESGKPIFVVKDLKPFETRPLIKVPNSKGVTLATQQSSGTKDEWMDPYGTPYNLRLEEGRLYCIVVDPLGKASMTSLQEDYKSDPKVSALNGTSDTLAQVQMSPDFNKNVKVYIQDLPPNQPTEFYSLKPKNLSFFWQTYGQTFTGDFFRMEKSSGGAVQQVFEEGHLYFFLAANGIPGDIAHGKIWDITPKND